MTAEYQKIPTLVDPHVHLREPGATHKEDFATGTMAAIAGGFTTVLDMPNNPEPTISPEALRRKIELAGSRIYCDVGFHFGATAQGVEYFEAVKDQVFGLKVYMNHTTGPLLVEDMRQLRKIFSSSPRGKPILVHAEGDTLKKAISLARQYEVGLHACHISTKREIETVRKAKEEGLRVTCEVTPHNLYFTEDDAAALGSFGIMRPPLGSEKDRQALWKNLKEGVVDIIATDHAPHTIMEKLSDKPPFGVPGLETTLPLLLTSVAEGRLTLDEVVKLTSTNPRKIFGLPRATDQSYVLLDLEHRGLISSDNLQTKCGWTPFDRVRVIGRIAEVVFKGKIVYDGENIVGNPRGEVIFPNR